MSEPTEPLTATEIHDLRQWAEWTMRGNSCPPPSPNPECKVVASLVDAAIEYRQSSDKPSMKLYEITPSTKGATMKQRSFPELRINE